MPTRMGARERTLLLVDDESHVLSALQGLLQPDGYRILLARSAPEALEVLANNAVGVVMSDHRMPGQGGIELLTDVKALYPDTVRILLSGYADLRTITEAMNQGAVYKFFVKPWDDEQLRANVREAFAHKAALDEKRELNERIGALRTSEPAQQPLQLAQAG